MLKFLVVLYRRADVFPERFHAILRDEHGPMAERIPGLRRYVQNHVVADPTREPPGWDAVIELRWESDDAMEEAWRSPAGRTATDDLVQFADLERTSWSIVERRVRR